MIFLNLFTHFTYEDVCEIPLVTCSSEEHSFITRRLRRRSRATVKVPKWLLFCDHNALSFSLCGSTSHELIHLSRLSQRGFCLSSSVRRFPRRTLARLVVCLVARCVDAVGRVERLRHVVQRDVRAHAVLTQRVKITGGDDGAPGTAQRLQGAPGRGAPRQPHLALVHKRAHVEPAKGVRVYDSESTWTRKS